VGSPPIVVIVGPTASGKSSLALALAQRTAGEIVCADSMQVYRGLDIGTGKPSAEERRQVPHHLVDLVAPDEPFTAADYARLARRVLAEIRRRGRVPIVVGGTGLYVRALFRGLFEGPGENPSIRASLRKEAETSGSTALHRRLADLDPAAAARIHPNDLFRIVRALEIVTLTGRPISGLRDAGRHHPRPILGPVLRFGLDRHRDELYRRIEERVDRMMEQGLLEEVRDLLARGYVPTLKPLRALGYRHMIGYLKGEMPLHRAIATLKRDTRRYAKRQLTWFRRERDLEWQRLVGPGAIEPALDVVMSRIEEAWTQRPPREFESPLPVH